MLVVDDQPTVRDLVAHALTTAGIEVVATSSSAAALVRASEPGLDAILLDLAMPGLSGADVLRALRARGIATPVVLMSGFAEAHVRDQLDGLAPDGFLQKPFRTAELLTALGRALARD